jgi:YhcH/YjgK/YiaL family protein
MILDTLDAIGKYAGISPNFETAVRWLQETDPEALEPGRTDIDGEKVYAVVSENRLESKEPVFEVHRRYADIQIILQGREGFLYGREGRVLSGKPENDVWFCEADRQVPFELEEGGVTVFLPGEAHAPGLYPEKDRRPLSPAAPVPDRKLVVKVLMD